MKIMWRNVPIPPQHVIGLIAGGLLHLVLNDPLIANSWSGLVAGSLFILIGICLVAWSVWHAGQVDMAHQDGLITTGPYSISRNPMYLAWMLLYAGISLVSNSLWMVALLPLIALYTHYIDVIPEERLLDQKFGQKYQRYREQTRRYF